MCWELRRGWSVVVGVLWTANTSPWMSTRPAWRASPYEAQNRATQMRSVLWQCSGWIYVAVERKSATRIAPAGCSSWEMHKIFSAQKPTVYYASHPLTHRPAIHRTCTAKPSCRRPPPRWRVHKKVAIFCRIIILL